MKPMRYGNSASTVMTNVFMQTSDIGYALFRGGLVVEVFRIDPSSYTTTDVNALTTAYMNVLGGFIAAQ